jgi:hypothetical protein
MRIKAFAVALSAVVVTTTAAQQTFTGTITDSMCVMNHQMMKTTPESKCARECVRRNKDVKWVLYDGKNAYKLSDQQTPEKFAAQRVKLTGQLFPKTGVIKVDKIQPLR